MTSAAAAERWIENGHEHALCDFCRARCSTHPDAANPLAPCGDCGRVTCEDHRVLDEGDRCVDCAAVFYAQKHRDDLADAHERVIDRMDGGEELEAAVEAVYCDYGGMEFRRALVAFAGGRAA